MQCMSSSANPTKGRMFQSSPGQKAGCNLGWIVAAMVGGALVSILTRPEGRMQFPSCRRPERSQYRVSILTRPEGRMQSDVGDRVWHRERVSILTRPEGRMQFRTELHNRDTSMFQSSPGQKAGCNTRRSTTRWRWKRFNPHPARRPDAICRWPEGRMMMELDVRAAMVQSFQSSPGQKAGCNTARMWVQWLMSHHFQSSPGQKAGCNSNPHPGRILRFQSSPGQKAGCNSSRPTLTILTRPEGRLQLVSQVSILTRPEGRMQSASRRVFQSSPGQCNPVRVWSIGRFLLTRPEGRINKRQAMVVNPHPARRPDAISPLVPNSGI